MKHAHLYRSLTPIARKPLLFARTLTRPAASSDKISTAVGTGLHFHLPRKMILQTSLSSPTDSTAVALPSHVVLSGPRRVCAAFSSARLALSSPLDRNKTTPKIKPGTGGVEVFFPISSRVSTKCVTTGYHTTCDPITCHSKRGLGPGRVVD